MPKWYLTGGGKQKDSEFCYFRKQADRAVGCFRKLIKKLNLRAAYAGSILIEFAVCMPVLIVLLYYVHDLSKLKRYHDQTEFVAQQMVNMIQNISQKRDVKAIKKEDIANILGAAWLTMFPGMTRYNKPLGYVPGVTLYYVKGLDNGNACCCWRVWITFEKLTDHSLRETQLNWSKGSSSLGSSIVKWSTDAVPSAIYPSLNIEPYKHKIILETTLLTNPKWNNLSGKFSNTQKFRFHMLDPKKNITGSGFHTLFNSVVIFTPQEGLFSEEEAPK